MSATVTIIEKNGAPGTPTDKTSGTVRHKNADDANVDTNNPLVKGTAVDYSFEKWLRVKVTGGSYTQMSNIRAYTDGTNGWTGMALWWKKVTAYATPAEGTSTTGYADAFSYTSAAPLTIGTGTYTGTGEMADHLVSLMVAGTNAVGGMLTAESFTVAWDEI